MNDLLSASHLLTELGSLNTRWWEHEPDRNKCPDRVKAALNLTKELLLWKHKLMWWRISCQDVWAMCPDGSWLHFVLVSMKMSSESWWQSCPKLLPRFFFFSTLAPSHLSCCPLTLAGPTTPTELVYFLSLCSLFSFYLPAFWSIWRWNVCCISHYCKTDENRRLSCWNYDSKYYVLFFFSKNFF